MKIRDSVAFVTGANRGLGLAFVQELLAVGAWKVYAAARDPKGITLPGAIPISQAGKRGCCHSRLYRCKSSNQQRWNLPLVRHLPQL